MIHKMSHVQSLGQAGSPTPLFLSCLLMHLKPLSTSFIKDEHKLILLDYSKIN